MHLQRDTHSWLTTRPPWQQELFLLAQADEALLEASLDNVIAIALGLATPDRSVNIDDLPSDLGAGETVQILDVEHVAGVNRLHPGAVLPFIHAGVNVVYGYNGSGKSGWARILKHAGRARERSEVLGDAFSDPLSRPRPEAALRWSSGGGEHRLGLALDEPAPVDLASTCVFDGASGARLLAEDNEVDYVPSGLQALQRLASAQAQLLARLRARIEDLQDAPLDLAGYAPGSETHSILASLSAETRIEAVANLAKLNDAESHRAAELRKQVAEIDAGATGTLAEAAEQHRRRLDELADELKRTATELLDASTDLSALRAAQLAATRLSSSAFEDEPLAGVTTEPWLVMWRAAEAFMSEAHGIDFPVEHDPGPCPLCMQELDAVAADRLQRFRAWVRSATTQQAAAAANTWNERLTRLPDVPAVLNRHYEALDLLDRTHPEVAGWVRDWLVGAAAASGDIAREVHDSTHGLREPPLEGLAAIATAYRADAEQRRVRADADHEERLRIELASFEERTRLAQDLEGVVQRIDRLQEAFQLRALEPDFSTSAVSTKIRTLAATFVTEALEVELRRQLTLLNFADVDVIGCRTSGRQGASRVGLKVRTRGDVPITALLSDGEQRRLSLAFFLAEAAMAYEGHPVVLDDPVCSVDHQGRRHIARTLTSIAARRQVIVFTHELAFLHELQQACRSADVQLNTLYVEKAAGHTGVVRTQMPWTGKNVKQRVAELRDRHSKLSALHRRDGASQEYSQSAGEFCRLLRQGFERAVEDEVLGGVVTRQDPGVHLQQLDKVAWSEDICRLSDRGLDEASPWVHDSSRALAPDAPTPAELKDGLSVLEALTRATLNVRETRRTAAASRRLAPGVAPSFPGVAVVHPLVDGDARATTDDSATG